MKRVVCAMFIIVIKDLKIYLSNLNLPIGKSEICFKPLAQKREISKQIANTRYYKY